MEIPFQKLDCTECGKRGVVYAVRTRCGQIITRCYGCEVARDRRETSKAFREPYEASKES